MPAALLTIALVLLMRIMLMIEADFFSSQINYDDDHYVEEEEKEGVGKRVIWCRYQ